MAEYEKELDLHSTMVRFIMSLEDIAIWQSIDGFNSLDSIAYYTTRNIDEFGSLNPVKNIKNILSLFK